METFQEYIAEYKTQLEKGILQKAYKGLMEYIMGLRTHLANTYPDYFVSSSIYYGYMDMTYFSFFPPSLKARGLKAGIVFIHEHCRFEAWLFGYNKGVQTKYWNFFKESGWDKYHLVPTTKGEDSILEHILVKDPDFSHLDHLTGQIEAGSLAFIADVEQFLSSQALPMPVRS